MKNKELKILLSAPRGFCAGVERAIEIVEKSIQKYGSPVYVRHEIVHNKFVVDDLRNKGAIFVEELEEIEDKTRPVIFSAHGVPKKIPQDAKKYNMTGIVKYVKESFEELKSHVSWPGFNEGLNLTVLVAVFSVIFSLIIWGLDSMFSRVIKEFFNLIS